MPAIFHETPRKNLSDGTELGTTINGWQYGYRWQYHECMCYDIYTFKSFHRNITREVYDFMIIVTVIIFSFKHIVQYNINESQNIIILRQ